MRHSYEDIHRLVLAMREGSTTARRELIEAHVPLAFKCAQEFEDDEALSDALMVLVQEVDNFRGTDRHPAALPAYLKTALGRAAMAHRRARAQNSLHDGARFLRSGRSLPEFKQFELIDAMDDILASCEDDLERAMVYYRSMGHNNHQVGLFIGYSGEHVAKSMQRLQLRFAVKERHRA